MRMGLRMSGWIVALISLMALHSTSCLATVMTCTQPGHANTPGQIKKKEESCQAIHHVSEVMEGGLSHRLLLRLINESAVCSTCRLPREAVFQLFFYLLLVETKEAANQQEVSALF